MIHISETGQGQPIILLHGFCENHHIWDSLSNNLASEFRILSVDLPGFGQSSPLPDKCSALDEVADIIADELRIRKIEPAFIVGHSLGGYITLALAELHPQLIRGLALINSTTFSDSTDKKRTRNKIIKFISKHGVQPFIDLFIDDIFYNKEEFTEAIEMVRAMGMSCTRETLIQYTGLMRDRSERTFLLTQPDKPAMVIAGNEDGLIPVGQSQEMIDFLPKGQGVILESCGHMAMFERPNALHESLIQFVHQHTTTNN